jgi:hypothetical protein
VDPLVVAILPICAAAIGWGFYLAFQAGKLLHRVEERLDLHDERLTRLEQVPGAAIQRV